MSHLHEICIYICSAFEKRSPGRQMRPINAPGDPEPHHRWSGWRLVNSPKFRCWHSSSIVFELFICCPNQNYYKIMYTHYLSRVNRGNVGRFLDHNIRHMIARDSPNPTGAFHTSTESVDSLVSKYRPSIINALVVSQSESRKLHDVILGQSRTERGNFGLTWGNVGHCLG